MTAHRIFRTRKTPLFQGLSYRANIVQIAPQEEASLVSSGERGVSYIALISCKLPLILSSPCEKWTILLSAKLMIEAFKKMVRMRIGKRSILSSG